MTEFRKGNTRAATLTGEKVLEIRRLYAEGRTQGSLSREFGVGVAQIGKIVRGESWQQLPVEKSQAELELEGLLSQQKFVERFGPPETIAPSSPPTGDPIASEPDPFMPQGPSPYPTRER